MPLNMAESAQKDVKRKLTRVVRMLEEKYGPHIYPEDGQGPLEQVIFAILAAKNPVTNARKALRDLREEYVDWNEARAATVRMLQDTLDRARIEPSGKYAEIVKQLLMKTFNEVCRMSLDSLRTDGPEKARKIVSKLDVLEPHEQQYLLVGAGVEEAPPLDPATDRINLRLGLFGEEDAPAKRRKLLETHVASSDALRFHHLMVEHGKKLCTEADPKCPKCPAQTECDWFKAAEVRKKAEEKVKAAAKAAKPAAPAGAEKSKEKEKKGDAGKKPPPAAAKGKPPAPAAKGAAAATKGKAPAKPAKKAGKRGRGGEEE